MKKTALKIVSQKGTVTTLEIKTALRKKGYFATQQQVSVYMAQVATAHHWDFWNNGQYRLYFQPEKMFVGGQPTFFSVN